MFKKPLKVLADWLYFTISERRAAFYLGAIVIILTLTPFFYDMYFRPEPQLIIKETLIAQLEQANVSKEKPPIQKNYLNSFQKVDINKVKWVDLIRKGISKESANKIINYRKAIGSYTNLEQIERVYGLSTQELAILNTEFKLPKPKEVKATELTNNFNQEESTKIIRRIVNINTADSFELMSLDGIGPYYATRILKFRRAMGGFHSIQQLNLVFGLPDSTINNLLPQIKCEGAITRLEINILEPSELAIHSLISYKQAKLIWAYKLQHGPYTSIDEVRKAGMLSQETAERLEPYLSY